MTLAKALRTAQDHWGGRKGSATMTSAASRCVAILGAARGVSEMGPPQAVELLAALRAGGLGAKSVAVYYAAFRRMLALSGVLTTGWPSAPTPPRKTRDALKPDDLERLLSWLRWKGYGDTADLAILMRGTGLRVNVEALTEAHLRLEPGPKGSAFDVLHVVGKGAHERLLPVVRSDTRELLRDPVRMSSMRARPYRTHCDRWARGVAECSVTTRLATPHAVRHGYAAEVLRKSGGNVAMVRDLLGHANIATTSAYLSVDLVDMAGALSVS